MSIPKSVRSGRTGLTLMELVVVLVILIALGAIVLPMFPNLLTKAHDATTVTNIQEINKAIVSYFSSNLRYPDQFDSLFDSSGAIYSKTIFAGAQFTPSNGGGSRAVFTPSTVQAGEDFSLSSGGIKNLMVLNPNPGNATFDAYINNGIGAGSSTPVAVGTKVLQIDDDYILQKLNVAQKKDASGNLGRYVVFGLGGKCALVGSGSFGIFNAPVSFGDHDADQPQNSYARMLLVFRIYSDNATRAEYVGSAHPDASGLGTSDMHLQEFYNNQ